MKKFIIRYLKNVWHQSASLNNEILKSLIEPDKNLKVLDIGCESGVLIKERLEGKVKNPEIYGLEIDPKQAREAKRKGIKVTIGNAEKKLSYKNNFFDIVSANQIIEHLVNTDFFLSEVHRALKLGGYLLISSENLSSWHNIFALILGWQAFSQDVSSIRPIGNPYKLQKEKKPSWALHVKIFTLKGLREALELHGFKIEKTFGSGYYPFSGTISRFASTIDPWHTAFIGLKARKERK